MNENMQKLIRPLGYTALFLVSLLFFVYLTFPYSVLKEALTAKIAKETGLDVRIEELEPALPLGFEAKNIRVAAIAGGPAMHLQSAEIKISLLNLLIGRLGINADLESKNGGTLYVGARLGLFALIFDQNFIPRRVMVEADKFAVGSIVSFLLSKAATSPTANPMFTGILTQIGLDGNLHGEVDLDINTSNLAQSSGFIDLQLKDAKLRIDDPSLNLADQNFSKALVKAELNNGAMKINKNSGFHTQELVVDLGGNMSLKPQLDRSTMDVDVSLKLDEGLKEQFGFLLDMAGGSGGAVKYQVKGTLGAPNVVTI